MANKYHVLKVHQIKNQNMQKNDTYSPFIFFFICNIFYTTTAFFWAITFENPSINDEMAAIWNFPENLQRAITSKKMKITKNKKKYFLTNYLKNIMSKFQALNSNGVGCINGTKMSI